MSDEDVAIEHLKKWRNIDGGNPLDGKYQTQVVWCKGADDPDVDDCNFGAIAVSNQFGEPRVLLLAGKYFHSSMKKKVKVELAIGGHRESMKARLRESDDFNSIIDLAKGPDAGKLIDLLDKSSQLYLRVIDSDDNMKDYDFDISGPIRSELKIR